MQKKRQKDHCFTKVALSADELMYMTHNTNNFNKAIHGLRLLYQTSQPLVVLLHLASL